MVLGALCRIVACAGASDGTLAGPVERWAQLALKRYEAVSDSDLLLIYIPLLHTCISIWLVTIYYLYTHKYITPVSDLKNNIIIILEKMN